MRHPVLVQKKKHQDAQSAGRIARLLGISKDKCIFPEGHMFHNDWIYGWQSADDRLYGMSRRFK